MSTELVVVACGICGVCSGYCVVGNGVVLGVVVQRIYIYSYIYNL